jgi:hypothetical protein
MISEPKHMQTTDSVNDGRLPKRSPMKPNSQPPSGRIRKVGANSTAALSCCTTGSLLGKKAGAKYSANAV